MALFSASSLEQWSLVRGPHSEDEVVGSLQALTAECVHGRNYCRQILCLYELSKVCAGGGGARLTLWEAEKAKDGLWVLAC